jgi:hypothetical protein
LQRSGLSDRVSSATPRSIVKEADDSLRFVAADGRTIPRNGYRLQDFVDDDVDGETVDAPRGGFCKTAVRGGFEEAGASV